nr:shikimate O-hydroxycinnamoyltransferase [Tanacetum cinerariifolium]
MVLEGLTGWKLCKRKWTDTTERLIEDPESAYGFDFDFRECTQYVFDSNTLWWKISKGIQTEGKSEPLYYNYLRPLTSLDEGLLLPKATTIIRATIEDITDEHGSNAAIEHIYEKMLLLTWHHSSAPTKEPVCDSVTPSAPTKEPVCDSVTPRSLPQHDSSTPCSDSVCTNDDDEDDDILVDEENKIIEPDVDVHLFGISIDVRFENIGVTNVGDDVLEGEDKFTTVKEDKDRVYVHSIKSRTNLKLYKNDNVRVRERCDGNVPVFTISQGTGPTDPNQGMDAGPSGSSGPTIRSKKKKNT